MNQLTFLLEEPPVKVSRLRASAKGSMTPEATSCLRFLQSLNVTGLDGLSGKTSPVSCHPTEDGILAPSSGRWRSWATGGPIGCWTHNGSEWPNAVAVCSLSDTLETQSVPQRFYLSAKACQGILPLQRRSREPRSILPSRP